jgi:hypothetical protein
MKLMMVDEFLENFYTSRSRPTRRTLIRLIKDGEVNGKKQGKFYYVDVDAERFSTGNTLVDRVLSL